MGAFNLLLTMAIFATQSNHSMNPMIMTPPYTATRLAQVKPSPTLAAGARTKALIAAGRDIIDLTLGEPDFHTPDYVKAAAIKAIEDNQTKYTAVDGTPAVKAAVQRKFKHQNGLAYAIEQISVGTGGKQVIYNALQATLSAGDEVIILAPYWTSYPDMILLADGVPVEIALSQDNGFKLTPAQLRAAITPKTKWLILNSPSNPCGAAYSRAELQALADELLNHPQVMILSDDLYEHILYDGEFVTIAQLHPDIYARTLTVNGVAKAYAMTGWRIGFAGGPKWLIDAMRLVQSQSTSNPCSVSQAATIAALDGDHALIRARTAEFKQRRDRTAELLNKIPGIQCHKPEGSFYLYPAMHDLFGKRLPDGSGLETDTQFVMYLLDHANVSTVQGQAFGTNGFFRISYATSLDKLEEACARIEDAVAKLKDGAV